MPKRNDLPAFPKFKPKPELPKGTPKIADLPLLYPAPKDPEAETAAAPLPYYVGLSRDPEADLPAPEVSTPEPAADRRVIVEAVVSDGPQPEPELRKKSSAVSAVAQQFVNLMQSGVSRTDAAEAAGGIPYSALKNRADIVAAVQQLMDNWHLDPDVRTKTRKGVVNKIMIESSLRDDPVSQKLALEAAKQIAADEGITDKKTFVGVNVNLADLAPFLSPPEQTHE